jgi:hypothetical protein
MAQNPHSLYIVCPPRERQNSSRNSYRIRPSFQRTITADCLPFAAPFCCLCLMWWDDVCNGMALDADGEWDFPRLPFVEKRAISILQLGSAGRARVRSPMSDCRGYKFDECLGRVTVAHLKSFFAFP